ncbi:ABC transporter substrate-binding protein [Actinomycetaceae bacterium TAE3-ERU4]|nr:ABC transporter substrate-binding protein [Actinomycetaceae bacterium TAE3-ERU4]
MYKKRLAIFGAVCALFLSACSTSTSSSSPQGKESGKPVIVGMSYIPNVQFSPFYLAEKEGKFGKQKVTLRHHGQNEGLFTALRSGTEDVVVAGADEAAVASRGDLLVISPYYQRYPVVLLVPEASSISSWSSLRGKKVGVPGRFGESWIGLLAGLKSAGMSVEDISVVEVGYTQKAALSSNKVDAVIGFSNNDSVQFALSGMQIKQIPLPANTHLVGASLITTKDYAKANPEALSAVVSGVFSASASIKSNPSLALESAKIYVPQLAQKEFSDPALATVKATIPLFASVSDCDSFTPDKGISLVDSLKGIGQKIQINGRDLFTKRFCVK